MLSAALHGPAAQLAGRLGRWLVSGRIQSQSGAFCAWRDQRGDKLAFEYPEITGYALTWLTGQERLNGTARPTAARAAGWLLDRVGEGDQSARAGWDAGAVYNFDLGMIAAGLLNLGRSTGEQRYEAPGLQITGALARQVKPGRGLAPLPPAVVSTRPSGWSTAGHVHMTKCVQALLLAGKTEAASELVHATLAAQRPDGRFITQPDETFTMLHPHFYAVEGLWMWGTATGDRQALDAARAATEWAWGHQLPDGALPRHVRTDGEVGVEQLDLTAQAVRAAVLLEATGPDLDAAVRRLLACAVDDGEDRAALVYQPGSGQSHMNAWVTMFAAQALRLAVEGRDSMSWTSLV